MTENEAATVVAELQGWNNVRTLRDEWDCFYILATNPATGQEMVYSAASGYFE